MSIGEDQLPKKYRDVVAAEIDTYKAGASITVVSEIPDTKDIPSKKTKEGKPHWLRIPGVICVYADMRNSTGMSAAKHDKSTARVYQLFSETAIRLFHAFDAAYIDVDGDAVFALFDADEPHRALAAAVSFKTFIGEEFISRVQGDLDVDVGCHLGMDARTVLVRRLGLQPRKDRTDRQNEVWAGRPVNMAAKLASLAGDKELIVSDRMWSCFSADEALRSCGCPDGDKVDLWTPKSVDVDDKFDFNTTYVLGSNWCEAHGAAYCEALTAFDGD